MTNCRMNDIAEYEDINTIDQYQVAIQAGCSKEEALNACFLHSRDNARTPMQWSDAPHGGFTTGTPWFALNPNYKHINVAEQQSRENSVLNYYKKLIALRKSDEYRNTFTYGTSTPAYETEPGVMAYVRETEDQKILVAGNYGVNPCTLKLEEPVKEVLLSNMGKESVMQAEADATGCIMLSSSESVVILF